MKHILAPFRDEDGSATIEFIGILPLVFIMMLVLWQFLVSVHGIIVTQSAVNEAAKVYSITESSAEASAAAQNIIQTAGSYITFSNAPITGSDQFTAQVSVTIDLVFLPEKIFGMNKPSFTYSSQASGKVIQ